MTARALIFTMTIPIPSAEEFQLFKPHPIPIHFDFDTDVISFIYMKSQVPYLAIPSNYQSHFATNEIERNKSHPVHFKFSLPT